MRTAGKPTDDVEGQGEVGDVQLPQEVVESTAEEDAENKINIKNEAFIKETYINYTELFKLKVWQGQKRGVPTLV